MISDLLSDKKIHDYVVSNLQTSLSLIGFSNTLVSDLTSNLSDLKVQEFGNKYSKELQEIYNAGFFRRLVPQYFSDYVVPEISAASEVLDLGCGTGVLASILACESKFQHITGIDLHSYPEWEIFKNSKITFEVVTDDNFLNYLTTEKPDAAVLTWVLHHMEFGEQVRYIGYLYKVLKPNSQLVILEDSYSTKLSPENDIGVYGSFMKFGERDRIKIMGIYDWVANNVLEQRDWVDIPLSYRTLEEWEKLFMASGFKIIKKKYIGFPAKRDINTPQSLIVLMK